MTGLLRLFLKKSKQKLEIARKLFRRFVFFYLPNIGNNYRSRFSFKIMPAFNQRTIFTGVGKIEIGINCVLGFKRGGFHHGGSIEIQSRTKNSLIKIGDYVATNNNIFFCAANLIVVGDHTLIGQNVTFMDFEAHGTMPDQRRNIGKIGKIMIGKNVWIGNNVTILKNTEIGDNSIVATGAVVMGKFPSNVIIGGVPAKIIKVLS